jgi:hypothetical protein
MAPNPIPSGSWALYHILIFSVKGKIKKRLSKCNPPHKALTKRGVCSPPSPLRGPPPPQGENFVLRRFFYLLNFEKFFIILSTYMDNHIQTTPKGVL